MIKMSKLLWIVVNSELIIVEVLDDWLVWLYFFWWNILSLMGVVICIIFIFLGINIKFKFVC